MAFPAVPVYGSRAALDLNGEWRSGAGEVRETVFASDEGCIEWRCLMPRARARVDDRKVFGYAEHLTMSIALWKLPIRTLRWGRFATESDWVVWIDWIGSFNRRILYANGESIADGLIEDDRVDLGDGRRLVMDRRLVLREGSLAKAALSAIPGVRDTFPARLLQVNECKWRSRARLERPGVPAVEGWAIHERVDWPK